MSKKHYVKPEITKEELQKQLFDLNCRLLDANEKLRQEEQTKTEFFANLSHDLRSPVAAVYNSIEYLRTGAADEKETAEILDMIQRRVGFMQHLINDMFLLTRIDNPDIRLNLEDIDIGIFLEETFYTFREDSKYDDRKLELSIPPDFNYTCRFDPEMITRVLDNFLTNAYKYSESGASLVLSAAFAEPDKVEISVSDTGIGISEEDIGHVFERTYRTSKARTPSDGSSGLGLAIAKSIVEKHGGEIGCESKKGEGSRFFFNLKVSSLSI